MNNLMILQEYLNNFRRYISPHLKPGIGLTSVSTPVYGQGAVVEFKLEPQANNKDIFNTASGSVNDVLKNIPQTIVGGNIDAIRFTGTNISLEPDRLLIIKGEDKPELYSDQGAQDTATDTPWYVPQSGPIFLKINIRSKGLPLKDL